MTPVANAVPRTWWKVTLVLWCAAELSYVAYAAMSYSGLYQWLAESELAWFGAYDPSGTVIGLLMALLLPGLLVERMLRRWVMRVAEPPALPKSSTRTVSAIAAAALTVGLGAGALALLQGARTPHVASIALASGSEVPPDADQLIVTGRAQRSRTVVLAEAMRGSTIQTAYTPLTAPDWRPTQPIPFMMRELLSSGTDEPLGTSDENSIVRFGPAALFRHDIPGVVRASLNRSGLVIATDAMLLDENLESASFGLWTIAFFGCAFALGLGLTSRLAANAQARHAGRAATLGVMPPPARWRLMLGSELMAELTFLSYETPWITVAVNAKPGLHAFMRYFASAKEWPDNDPIIHAMVVEVDARGGFKLLDGHGVESDSFSLVNLDETSANLRC